MSTIDDSKCLRSVSVIGLYPTSPFISTNSPAPCNVRPIGRIFDLRLFITPLLSFSVYRSSQYSSNLSKISAHSLFFVSSELKYQKKLTFLLVSHKNMSQITRRLRKCCRQLFQTSQNSALCSPSYKLELDFLLVHPYKRLFFKRLRYKRSEIIEYLKYP